VPSARLRAAGGLLILAACAVACEPSTGRLVVQVRTDLAPQRGFSFVRMTGVGPDGAEVERTVFADEQSAWGTGVRFAEIAALPRGIHTLDVAAHGPDSAVIVRRPVRVDIGDGVTVVTVLLTRSCRDVVCPMAGDDADETACVGGRCVVASCVEEGGCDGPRECEGPADCPTSAATCADVECTRSGTCFESPAHDRCADGEVCDVESGCVPVMSTELALGDPCTPPQACGSGLVCVERFGIDTGSCRTACAASAECSGSLRCVEFGAGMACAGNGCDPVAQTGCDPGDACDVISRADLEGTVTHLTDCRRADAVAPPNRCVAGMTCAPGALCVNLSGARHCMQICAGEADCAGPTQCLQLDAEVPFGVCTADCDLLANTGCPAGLDCLAGTIPRVDGGRTTAAFCVAAGAVPIGGSCDSAAFGCEAPAACIGGRCVALCDRAASDCTPPATCQAFSEGDPAVSGTPVGVCL